MFHAFLMRNKPLAIALESANQAPVPSAYAPPQRAQVQDAQPRRQALRLSARGLH